MCAEDCVISPDLVIVLYSIHISSHDTAHFKHIQLYLSAIL